MYSVSFGSSRKARPPGSKDHSACARIEELASNIGDIPFAAAVFHGRAMDIRTADHSNSPGFREEPLFLYSVSFSAGAVKPGLSSQRHSRKALHKCCDGVTFRTSRESPASGSSAPRGTGSASRNGRSRCSRPRAGSTSRSGPPPANPLPWPDRNTC